MDSISKIYGLCINSERRKNLEKYEKLLNIVIDTSFSENAFNKNLNYYKSKNKIVKDWKDSLGAVGCTLSFQNIYEDILKNKYEYSIIFEDDIDWNEDHYGKLNKNLFDEMIEKIFSIEKNWDIFYLGSEMKCKISEQLLISDNVYELESGKINIPIKDKSFKSFDISRKSNPKRKHRNFGGQQAIIISLKGAANILKYHNPAYCISDGIMGYAISNGDLVNRAFLPTLFTQLSQPRNINRGLWVSQTGSNEVKSGEKYKNNTNPIKKGCSEFPVGNKKYSKIPGKEIDWVNSF